MTYKMNFPNHRLIVNDIKNINEKQIKEYVGNNKIDVIIGGPPCQGFSIAGIIGRNFIDDERNRLFCCYNNYRPGVHTIKYHSRPIFSQKKIISVLIYVFLFSVI